MKRHGSSFEIVSFTEGSYSVWQVKNLAGSETQEGRGGSTASRRLAAHRHGRAIWDGGRSISGVLRESESGPQGVATAIKFVLRMTSPILRQSLPSRFSWWSYSLPEALAPQWICGRR